MEENKLMIVDPNNLKERTVDIINFEQNLRAQPNVSSSINEACFMLDKITLTC